MAPRLSRAASDSKTACDRASESLRARRMALESAKLETLIETLGAWVLCVATAGGRHRLTVVYMHLLCDVCVTQTWT